MARFDPEVPAGDTLEALGRLYGSLATGVEHSVVETPVPKQVAGVGNAEGGAVLVDPRTGEEVAVVSVDITCDLMDEDETGFVWTFLREARDRSLISPGALVLAGDSDAPAVAEVVDIVEKPAGAIVHLRLLPGDIEDYAALVRRAITTA